MELLSKYSTIRSFPPGFAERFSIPGGRHGSRVAQGNWFDSRSHCAQHWGEVQGSMQTIRPCPIIGGNSNNYISLIKISFYP
jgi:hypothetical protein